MGQICVPESADAFIRVGRAVQLWEMLPSAVKSGRTYARHRAPDSVRRTESGKRTGGESI